MALLKQNAMLSSRTKKEAKRLSWPCRLWYDRKPMNVKKGLIIAGSAIAIAALIFFLIFNKTFFAPSKAALQISSTPNTRVFLNDTEVGITPFFDNSLNAEEYSVKLVPQDESANLIPWEGKVTLTANIVTSINYELGENQEKMSGKIITLERVGDLKSSSLSIVSQPEVLVKVNGESKDYTPILLENLEPKEYQITLNSPGFVEKEISAQTIAGYKLILSVKLARKDLEGISEATASGEEENQEESQEEDQEEEAKSTPSNDLEKPYVKILSTDTGWLRVRSGPGISFEEIAKVKPEETYPYLEEENGWYKIEVENEEGWISGTYAELIE